MAMLVTREQPSEIRWRFYAWLIYLNQVLMEFVRTPGNAFLIVEAPVRHGKSELCSKFFPAWYLLGHPDQRVILTGHNGEFATVYGRAVRNILTVWGPKLGILDISRDSSAADRWDIEGRSGGMIAVGVGQPPQGRGGNLIVIDDPIKSAVDAHSPVAQENCWRWYKEDIRPRLEPNGKIAIIMARRDEKDLVGRLKEREKQGSDDGKPVDHWKVIHLPALAEPTEDMPDPLGREWGQPLCPQRFPLESLLPLQDDPIVWESLYQNRPSLPEGELFKTHWWNYVKGVPYQTKFLRWWDMAGTEQKHGTDPDWTAGVLLGFHEGRTFIVDANRIRATDLEVERFIKSTAQNDDKLTRTRVPIIMEQEPGSSGKSTIAHYTRKILQGHIFEGRRSTGDKVLRARPFAGQVQAGNVFLMEAPWNQDFVNEFRLFPTPSSHDDWVDATCLGFNAWNDASVTVSTYEKKSRRSR